MGFLDPRNIEPKQRSFEGISTGLDAQANVCVCVSFLVHEKEIAVVSP